MAYPKLNAIAFWMIPPAGVLIWLGFADFTWYATRPYSIISAPGPAADMWIFGLKILGISSVLGALNFVVTILKCKHPDMSIGQIPLMAWAFLSSSLIIIVAIPTFAAALLMLLTDRLGVSGFFNPAMGGDPIAYAHLFWFTFHPEVYVLVIPAIGMMYEIIPRFSRKPIYSYMILVYLHLLCYLLLVSHHGLITCMQPECLSLKKQSLWLELLAAVPASAMHVHSTLLQQCGMVELNSQPQ